METGLLKKQTIKSGVIFTTNFKYCQEKKDYVAGGIIFNYAAGTYSSAPVIDITVELKNLAYSSDLIVTSVVTSNTTTSTTVRVNVGTVGGGVAEASTDDVTIHLVATA